MKHIVYDDAQYIVNEEEGVVVCIIHNCAVDAIATVDEAADIFSGFCCMPPTFYMNDQYKGVARCMPEDTFDVEYGKKLAYRKAYTKYSAALEKKVNYIVNSHLTYLGEVQSNLDKAVSKASNKAKKAVELYTKVLEEAKDETA